MSGQEPYIAEGETLEAQPLRARAASPTKEQGMTFPIAAYPTREAQWVAARAYLAAHQRAAYARARGEK